MSMRVGSLVLAAAAVGLFVGSTSLRAQEQKGGAAGQGTRDRGGASQGMMYEGKIGNVDASKREVTLSDARRSTGTGTGTSGTGTSGTGTSGTGTGSGSKPATGGTGTGGTRTGADDRGTAGKGQMRFHLTETARITVDGKPGELRDLKSGLYARVHVQQSGSRPGTSGTGTSGTGTSGTGTSGSGTGAGSTMMADRIEAFTKNPTGTGTGSGTGTRP